MNTRPIEERFWEKVDIRGEDECWNWKASIDTPGYGGFKVGGGKKNSHRVAWILTHGDVPGGMDVCHKCDNRLCCNPNHLWIGTRLENVTDMMNKGRQNLNRDYWTPENREKFRQMALIKRQVNINAPKGTKWCYSCRTYLPLCDFSKNRSKPTGLQDQCRKCVNTADKHRQDG